MHYYFQGILNNKNYQRGNFPGVENLYLAVGENGLIVVKGEVHKKLRKLASPAFKLSSLKKVMPIIEMCGERLVKLCAIRCNESEDKIADVEVKEILNKTTLDVIGLMAFGHDFKESCTFDTNTFGHDLREWLDQGMELSIASALPFVLPIKRLIINFSRYLPNFLSNTYGFRLAYTTNKIHDLVEEIVQSKIEERRSDKGIVKETNNKTLLDFILDASDTVEIYKKEIHDILMTFLIAGHETATLTVTWTLYFLTQYPTYQEKCRREVNTFFENHTSAVDWDDLKQLSFLNAVIHESLRLFPPVPWLQRVNINADEIAGYYIPPNSDILLLIIEMHRNPKHWPDPEKFIPERFLEPAETIPWHAFMPFGDGVHKCIGYQLAITEALYFTAILLKNFQFLIDERVEYHDYAVITIQPKPALKLHVKLL